MQSIFKSISRACCLGVLIALALVLIAPSAAAIGDERNSANPLSGNAEAIAAGKTLFRAGCGYCHGLRANGRGRGAPAGAVAADLTKYNRGYLAYIETVKNGYKLMPPWGGLAQLTDDELNQIGSWLETMGKSGSNWKDPK